MYKHQLRFKILELRKSVTPGSTITITVKLNTAGGTVVYSKTTDPRKLLKPMHSHNMFTGFELTKKFRDEVADYISKCDDSDSANGTEDAKYLFEFVVNSEMQK